MSNDDAGDDDAYIDRQSPRAEATVMDFISAAVVLASERPSPPNICHSANGRRPSCSLHFVP